MLDGEPDEDLGDKLEVDEEEISACAPYLASQISCLGRVASTGREGGYRSLHPEGVRRWLACRNKETNTQRSTQVQAAQRLTALLLHVWIYVIMVASYKLCSERGTRQGGG